MIKAIATGPVKRHADTKLIELDMRVGDEAYVGRIHYNKHKAMYDRVVLADFETGMISKRDISLASITANIMHDTNVISMLVSYLRTDLSLDEESSPLFTATVRYDHDQSILDDAGIRYAVSVYRNLKFFDIVHIYLNFDADTPEFVHAVSDYEDVYRTLTTPFKMSGFTWALEDFAVDIVSKRYIHEQEAPASDQGDSHERTAEYLIEQIFAEIDTIKRELQQLSERMYA